MGTYFGFLSLIRTDVLYSSVAKNPLLKILHTTMRHHALVEILSGGAKIKARAGKAISKMWRTRYEFITEYK